MLQMMLDFQKNTSLFRALNVFFILFYFFNENLRPEDVCLNQMALNVLFAEYDLVPLV